MDRINDGSWLDDMSMGRYKPAYSSIMRFVEGNKFNLGVFVVLLIFIFRQFKAVRERANASGVNHSYLEAEGFPEIEALEKFNHEDEDPIKLRLFKPKYFVTMGE